MKDILKISFVVHK